MFTLFHSIGRVIGAEVALVGYFICLIVFACCYLAIKYNRSRKNILKGIMGTVGFSIVCDIIWFFYYFLGGKYYNHGIAGAYLMLLWPLFLIVLGIGLTKYNKFKY